MDTPIVGPTGPPDVDQERRVAIYDLLEGNRFALIGGGRGPYDLHLAIEETRLVFEIKGKDDAPARKIVLAGTPFRRVVRDYFQVCESYFAALKSPDPDRLQAIDMGRRGVHDEGAGLLKARLESLARIDMSTARRLFTLLSILHIRPNTLKA